MLQRRTYGAMAPIPMISGSIATFSRPRSTLSSIHHLITRAISSLPRFGSLRPFATELSSIIRRQAILPIPATYTGLNAGPQPGTVVGITLGSVCGFLLILWLLYTCFGQNASGGEVIVEESVRRRSPRRRSVSVSETTEVRSPPRRERTPPRREPSRRETVIIEEVRRPVEREDDIVEVIEEHSPPRRPRSQRVSGYRTVDPEAYGGGDRPLRKVRR